MIKLTFRTLTDDSLYAARKGPHTIDELNVVAGCNMKSHIGRFLSSRYIFHIFRTFSTLVIFTFYFFSNMFYAFLVMNHAYSLVLFELLMAKLYLSFILLFQLDFTLVFFISLNSQEHTLEKDSDWWNSKTRSQ